VTAAGLLFDCDGVLADSEPLNFRCWNQAIQEILGASLPPPASALVGLDLDRILLRGLAAAGRAGEPVTPALRAALLARKSELFFALTPALRPVPGALALVARARELRLPRAVVSAALRVRLFHTLEALGLGTDWGVVLSGEDLLPGSIPRKDWRRAAAALGVPLGRCAVFEDSAEGVASAREQGAGWVIGLTTGLPAERLREAGACKVIRDLEAFSLDELAGGGA
jgi:beta-phosphoglucomutase-like phosphatase (HAD superfamily)